MSVREWYTFDTETEVIHPGNVTPRVVCLQSMRSRVHRKKILSDAPNIHTVADFSKTNMVGHPARQVAIELQHSKCIFVGHNIPYDWGVLCAEMPELLPLVFKAYDEDRIRCTQIREMLLGIKRGTFEMDRNTGRHSLGGLTKHYLNQELDKKGDTWRFKYGRLLATPLADWPSRAVAYALSDVASTFRVYRKQAQRKDLVSPDEHLQTRAHFALHLISCWGIRTDPVRVKKLGKTLEREAAKHRAYLQRIEFLRQPVKSGKKAGHISRNMENIKAAVTKAYDGRPARTEGGAVQTTDEILRNSGNAKLIRLAEYNSVNSIISKFMPVIARGTTHPINARFNPLVKTARTSCSDPNLQQLPRKWNVRECFIPRDGYVFVSVDFDQGELVSLAHILLALFGYSKMADALRAGKDLHMMLAAKILGIAYKKAQAARVLYDSGNTSRNGYKLGKKVDAMRQLAKVANFGFPGGLGAPAFVDYYNGWTLGEEDIETMTEERAHELRNSWFQTWPEMRDYFTHIGNLTGDFGPKSIVQFGSKRVRGKVKFTEAANGFFQSKTADGAKEALWMIQRACYVEKDSPAYGSRIVNFIHDEYLCECPRETFAEAGDEIARLAREGMALHIPDLPIGAEPAAMLRWTKGAKTVRNAQGKLQIWRPKK